MSTQQGAPVSGFSANSKQIKSFRFHQKLRSGLVLAVIVIPIIGAFFAYRYYKQSINPSAPAPVAVTAPSSPTTSTTPTVENAPGTAAPTSTMPEGVTAALNSIEQNGMKSNPYITADTSNIPNGTVVSVDRTSWTTYGTDMGSVTTTMSLKGTTKKGTLTFQLLYGSWKVVGYSIES